MLFTKTKEHFETFKKSNADAENNAKQTQWKAKVFKEHLLAAVVVFTSLIKAFSKRHL